MARQHAYSVEHFEHRAERLLFQVPIYIAVALGVGLMLTRFILVLAENLKSSPENWRGVLLLAIIIGTASLIIVAACTVVGAVVGFTLRAVFASRFKGRLAAHR